MRSCDETLELISAALDGALTGDEQAALDEHLSHCPACSALFDELKSLQEAAAGLEDSPAPAGFSGRVMNSIAADPAQEQTDNVVPFPAKRRSRTPWKGWAASAAVVAIVVLGAVTLPGQLGVSNKPASTADYAAPSLAQEETKGTSTPMDPSAEKSASTESYNYNNARIDADSAAPECVPDLDSPASAEPQEKADSAGNGVAFAVTGSSMTSCGTVTLTGGELPDGLEQYEGTKDEQGNLVYVVPADYFFSVVQTLQDRQFAEYRYDPAQPDAEHGVIIVEFLP